VENETERIECIEDLIGVGCRFGIGRKHHGMIVDVAYGLFFRRFIILRDDGKICVRWIRWVWVDKG